MGLKDLFRRDRVAEPPPPEGLELARGERVLATAAVADGVLAVTSHRLVAPGVLAEGKPWHLVDSGGWGRDDSDELRVSWLDGTPAQTWALAEPGRVPQTFRERVQASVIISEQVSLDRSRRARVVLRKELATGRILSQTIVARGCDPNDPELVVATERVAVALAEQAGIDI